MEKIEKEKMKILFRTGGGTAKCKQLGLGHVYRCINLGKELKPSSINFLLEDFGHAEKIIKKNGFKNIHIIKKNPSIIQDLNETIHQIKKNKIDILIIDQYKISKTYVKKIGKFIKTIIITDLKDLDYQADLIVNGFIGYKNKIGKNQNGVRCLMGPKYQILNKNFQKNNKKKNKKIKVLATFGGFDEQNISDLLIKTIKDMNFNDSVKIIKGPASYKKKKYKNIPKNIKIQTVTDNMKIEMENAQYGLCSGGLTTYEFASLNVPFGIICQNNHQLLTAKEWEKRKLAVNLGLMNNLTSHNIENFLNKISYKKIKFSKKRIVDGLGTKRILKEISKIIEK